MNRIRLDYEIGNLNDLDFIENQKKAYKESKQMEKEQIKDAFTDGCVGEYYELNAYYTSEKYYNETYGKP